MIPLGIRLISEVPVARVVELVRYAEARGYAYCWIPEEGFTSRDIYVTTTAIAAATTRIKIGTGITNPYTRHPAVTLNAIAALDELSGGRAFLGLGAGGSLTLRPIDVLVHDRALTRCRELIDVARRLWAGETVSYAGARLVLHSARLAYGRRDIEIWVASRGPKMLRMAAEHADGVYLSGIAKFALEETIARVREGARERATPLKLALAYYVVHTDEDLQRVKPYCTYRLLDSPPEVKGRLGVTATLEAQLREALIQEGPHGAARLIRDDQVLPYVIHGDEAACAREIGAMVARYEIAQWVVPLAGYEKGEETIDRLRRIVALAG